MRLPSEAQLREPVTQAQGRVARNPPRPRRAEHVAQPSPQQATHERPEAEDHEIEQPLRARARIARAALVDEDVDRREEERVAHSMDDVDPHHQPQRIADREHEEAGRMCQDAERHRPAPSKARQRPSERGHRRDLGDLADAHRRHDPVFRQPRLLQERARPLEVALVHERIHRRRDEQHQHHRIAQQPDGFHRRARAVFLLAGGVCGRVSENPASAIEAMPATVKMLDSAACRSAPVLPARMKTNGQLAAIQPIVPQRRSLPNSVWAFEM